MNPRQAYEKMLEKSKEIKILGSVVGILGWDQRTNIPDGGRPLRVQQLTYFSAVIHKKVTDPEWADLLAATEGTELTADRLSIEAVNIREWRHRYDRATKIPEELEVALTKASAEGQAAWEKARPANDWNGFKPYLQKIVDLNLEAAEALGYENEPYDALLDDYERGETAASVGQILRQIRKPLIDLLDRIRSASKQPDPSIKTGNFPADRQAQFGSFVAAKIGYDFSGGRLDVSAHPFTSGIGPGDVRITTRYNEGALHSSLFGTIHEAGHGMHHQGMPHEHWGSPFCGYISLGIGESQSRFWENMVARSTSFWRYFYPILQSHFPEFVSVPMDDFVLATNEARPGLIRVTADEITYNMHILLRFELETALTRKELSVDDLPDAWNQKMKEYLGVTPPSYADGVMQDVHWSGGAIGYFPTYSLGNLYAAQFYAQAKKELGDLDSMFEQGEFAPLLHWLRKKIHSQGSRFLARELAKEVTGEDLNPRYMIDYLNAKYAELYEL